MFLQKWAFICLETAYNDLNRAFTAAFQNNVNKVETCRAMRDIDGKRALVGFAPGALEGIP